MKEYTLREICELVGVSRRAVQGYEQAELVKASGKNKYGYLLYDEKSLEQIRNIRMYQDFGFSIKEIKELIEAAPLEYKKMLLKQMLVIQKEITALQKNIEKMKELLVIDFVERMNE